MAIIARNLWVKELFLTLQSIALFTAQDFMEVVSDSYFATRWLVTLYINFLCSCSATQASALSVPCLCQVWSVQPTWASSPHQWQHLVPLLALRPFLGGMLHLSAWTKTIIWSHLWCLGMVTTQKPMLVLL